MLSSLEVVLERNYASAVSQVQRDLGCLGGVHNSGLYCMALPPLHGEVPTCCTRPNSAWLPRLSSDCPSRNSNSFIIIHQPASPSPQSSTSSATTNRRTSIYCSPHTPLFNPTAHNSPHFFCPNTPHLHHREPTVLLSAFTILLTKSA